MSAGEQVEKAHKLAGGACGQLCLMLTKRRISRGVLEQAAGDMEQAASIIRSLLTRSQAADKVDSPSHEGADNGTTDTGR